MSNCHPFGFGRHLFMHNGQIGGYEKVKRAIEAYIPDEVYCSRAGNGDSEAIFLIAAGFGLDRDPIGALKRTLQMCLDVVSRAGLNEPVRFSAIHADGEKLHAFRWSSDERPPTLYWRNMGEGIAVASEPFGTGVERWDIIPANTVATITGADISFDEFNPVAQPAVLMQA